MVRTQEKLTEQVTVRMDESLRQRLDEYVQRRSRQAGVVLSRAMAARELLEAALPADPPRSRARE